MFEPTALFKTPLFCWGTMPKLQKSTVQVDDAKVGEFWTGEIGEWSPPSTKLIITDPPYNIGIKYGKNVSDKKPKKEYHSMISEILQECYEVADDDAHLFLIHYPEAIAEMWNIITEKWEFKQWISWVYPTNTGHSTKRWINSHMQNSTPFCTIKQRNRRPRTSDADLQVQNYQTIRIIFPLRTPSRSASSSTTNTLRRLCETASE